ncbi:MAG: hypothetical protein PHQ40_12800 [Anaerolineaceae bacterium]|nr:hypothetical protein [Anaerolineaceae bacterium]
MALRPRPHTLEEPSIDKLMGIRNTLRPERQPPGALSAATNFIIDDTGTLERREGYAETGSFTNLTAAYATKNGKRLFLVDNGYLIARNVGMQDIVLAHIGVHDPLTWAEFGDQVFYSSFTPEVIGMIENGDTHMNLRFPDPSPLSAELLEGSLPAGQYQITAVYRDSAERQGPASNWVNLQASDNVSIRVILPACPDGYIADIYISPPDGPEVFLVGSTSGTLFQFDGSFENYAFPLGVEQTNCRSTPSWRVAIAAYNTRLYLATYLQQNDTSHIFISLPWWPWMYDISKDFFSVPHRVMGMLGTPDGILIGTERHIWLYTDDKMIQLANYGMPEGYPIYQDGDGIISFWTERGVHTFPPFKNLNEDKYSVPPGSSCYTAIINRHGMKQALVLTNTDGTAYNAY